jgi:hypothetical protein
VPGISPVEVLKDIILQKTCSRLNQKQHGKTIMPLAPGKATHGCARMFWKIILEKQKHWKNLLRAKPASTKRGLQGHFRGGTQTKTILCHGIELVLQ